MKEIEDEIKILEQMLDIFLEYLKKIQEIQQQTVNEYSNLT